MLLRVRRDATSPSNQPTYENMHVSHAPEMCLFTTSFKSLNTSDTASRLVEVTYTNPQDLSKRSLSIPLTPATAELATVDIDMHQSTTQGLLMAEEYSSWFSGCFGYEVVLVYLGSNLRRVLGNIAPNAATRNVQWQEQRRRQQERVKNTASSSSWFAGLVTNLPGLPVIFGAGGDAHCDGDAEKDFEITFADCSPYLIVSETSVENVSSRLPEGTDMDVTKFRPNIIVQGAEKAWDEDYWAEISVEPNTSNPDGTDALSRNGSHANDDRPKVATYASTIQLTANCVRCASLNVDYSTGAFGKGPAGQVLKKLQSDRRVDGGIKYSPVFGRYGFLASSPPEDVDFPVLSVGDHVQVTKYNTERTSFKWPGMAKIAKDDLFPI